MNKNLLWRCAKSEAAHIKELREQFKNHPDKSWVIEMHQRILADFVCQYLEEGGTRDATMLLEVPNA